MKLLHSSALVLLAGLSASAFAKSDSVTYACQNGQEVTVRYQFNDAGLPSSAEATLKGKKRTLRYDMDRSDDVDTFFKDKNGYRLSSDYLDVNNYRQSSIVITAPDSNILYKGCTAKPAASKKKNQSQKGKKSGKSGNRVAYMCQNNRRLNVTYRFNEQGIPVSATANLRGKDRTLGYDLNNSTDVDTFFVGQGYRIGTEYMDSRNYRSLPVNVTAPNDEILYKNCMPN